MNSIEYLLQALPWLGFFAAILIAWNLYLKARHKERLNLLDKGLDISDIYPTHSYSLKFPWLRFGIAVTGIGTGLLLAFVAFLIFTSNRLPNMGPRMLYVICGLLCGGISFIVAHYINQEGQRLPWLKAGIVITGIGLGLTSAYFIFIIFTSNGILNMGTRMLFINSGVLFGGMSLMLSQFAGRQTKKE